MADPREGGEEWAARELLADLGDGPMPESDVDVILALDDLLAEAAASPLDEDRKATLFGRARAASVGYPHHLEDFATDLDELDESLPPVATA